MEMARDRMRLACPGWRSRPSNRTSALICFCGLSEGRTSSFRRTPVVRSMTWEPKTRLTVLVMATAIPFLSSTEVWLCNAMFIQVQVRNDRGSATYGSVVDRDVVYWVVVVRGVRPVLK